MEVKIIRTSRKSKSYLPLVHLVKGKQSQQVRDGLDPKEDHKETKLSYPQLHLKYQDEYGIK